MSLLIEHGHVHARRYPLGMVWVETDLVNRRVNALKADQAVLTQMAVASLFSKADGGKFKEALKELRDDG